MSSSAIGKLKRIEEREREGKREKEIDLSYCAFLMMTNNNKDISTYISITQL
jgi:hypothetical protein